jgi:subtilase family protein
MKRKMWLAGALMALLWATPAKADTRVIVRTTSLPALQLLCALPATCTVVGALDGALVQVFLVTSPLDLTNLLNLLKNLTGFVGAEVDQVLNLVPAGALNQLPAPLPAGLLQDRNPVLLFPNATTNVWNSYANQPAAGIVKVSQAHSSFAVLGSGIVADIDTGVDPNHPALQGVLLPGFDFTRNQAGASELKDLPPTFPQPTTCTSTTCPVPARVNQSTAAVLDQSTAAVLDGNLQYAAFGHGTMVMGVIHLVAPTAQLLPLKAFHADGTGNLSDILRAIYYAVQNNASVVNMSFDFKTASTELLNALDYAKSLKLICAASAGNDGQGPPLLVYPAALQGDVMGVASTSDTDARSSFSNYGDAIVWVAAPGEAIVTTYPFSTYSAGWGTSFSAPFVSGGTALLHNLRSDINESLAAGAVAHAVALVDPGMGKGRLDLLMALTALQPGGSSPDFGVSAAPSSATITAGQQASFTVSAAPVDGFNQTVTWSCTGAPTAAMCTVSPSSVTLDGKNAATATVTLTTTARSFSPPLALPRMAPPMFPREVLMVLCVLLLVAVMFWNLSRMYRRRPGLATAAGLLAVSLCSYSCGGGYGTTPGPGSPTLSSIALNPSSVNGGSSSTGTVALSLPAPSGGAVVSLSSDNTAAATVPASVTVAYGATSATFTVSTSAATASTPLTITASYGGGTKTASLTVTPPSSATLSSLALNPTSVNGGSPSTGTVTLSGAAPTGGAQILLSSSNGVATVPSNVTVAAGATSATFTVNTSAVTASTPATISATYAGATKTASLTVTPVTPAGTYTLTITGTSGNLSHATTVQVTVN